MFASALIVGLLVAAPAAGAADLDPTRSRAIETAIEGAVRSRIGDDVRVTVTDVVGVRLVRDAQVLIALPDPAARIGAPARFVLVDGRGGETRARIGEATATVHATRDAVKALREVARGALIGGADVALQPVDLDGRPLRRLPGLEDVTDARASRDIAAGALLTASDFVAEPAVRTGQPVRAHVRLEDVEVTAMVTAIDNGGRDAIVRVMYPESRRVFRARVLEKGEVEVVDVR